MRPSHNEEYEMSQNLEYHQPVFDLLGVNVVRSSNRLATIEDRERICEARFPGSVREWFAIESAESLFYENSNQDELTRLEKLGDPAEVAQGYLRVATENQAVVAWYAITDVESRKLQPGIACRRR